MKHNRQSKANIALNHLLVLAESDPDSALELVSIDSSVSASMRLGDGSEWWVAAIPTSMRVDHR